MISLAVLAFATFASPAPSAGYASDTVAHMKGHPAIPARKVESTASSAPSVCHPDPSKGRVCRHHVAQAEQKSADAQLASAAAPTLAVREER